MTCKPTGNYWKSTTPGPRHGPSDATPSPELWSALGLLACLLQAAHETYMRALPVVFPVGYLRAGSVFEVFDIAVQGGAAGSMELRGRADWVLHRPGPA